MTVAHYTLHAYGSWLPDKSQGYIERGCGWKPQNLPLATAYRNAMRSDGAVFTEPVQLALIDALKIAATYQRLRFHFAACETSHIHATVSWRDQREIDHVKQCLKKSLTRRLNSEFRRRPWFVKGGSRRKVVQEFHFYFLKNLYFPAHSGWKWDEDRGLYP